MDENVVLTMRGISKEFPGVKALQNVDFTLCKGEIHALMGENGAGKSTLVKCLTGVYIKDAGEIRISGHEEPVNIRSPQDAQNLGISTVYQEITLSKLNSCRKHVHWTRKILFCKRQCSSKKG